jgi:hypothetical protein
MANQALKMSCMSILVVLSEYINTIKFGQHTQEKKTKMSYLYYWGKLTIEHLVDGKCVILSSCSIIEVRLYMHCWGTPS